MISAGLPTCSIVHAIVAVLPVPVAPSSVWKRFPALIEPRQLLDRVRLVAGRAIRV